MLINPFKISITQTSEWEDSILSNKDFINKYHDILKNLRIGCSFSPEHLEWLYHNEKKEFNEKKGLEILSFTINSLDIKDIRLGIRWNKAVGGKGQIDLTFYKKYLDILFENNVNICLNIGPIKTFRWPEQHSPDFLFENIKKPKVGEIIKPDSGIALSAYGFIRDLLKSLTREYSGQQLEKIKIIQPENEPFIKFGQMKWKLSEGHIEYIIQLVLEYLPHVKFLINSSEYYNLSKISKFYQKIIHGDNKFKNKLISGVNYFYKVPKARTLPFIGTFDSIFETSIKNTNIFEKNKIWADHIGFGIEITEGQAEPWTPILTPGNSASEFRFMVLRCANNILDKEKPSIIRVWGIEDLAVKALEKKLDRNHEEILEFIKIINNQ